MKTQFIVSYETQKHFIPYGPTLINFILNKFQNNSVVDLWANVQFFNSMQCKSKQIGTLFCQINTIHSTKIDNTYTSLRQMGALTLKGRAINEFNSSSPAKRIRNFIFTSVYQNKSLFNRYRSFCWCFWFSPTFEARVNGKVLQCLR